MSDYKVQLISSPETWDLRHRVLRPHQTLADCKYPLDDKSETFHVGATLGAEIICVSSFNPELHSELNSKNPYRLRGMATDPAFLQQGVGRAVLALGEQTLRERNCDLLWFNAREIAFPFYEKLGFKYLGPMFDMPGIGPHKVMYKTLI